MPPLLARCRGIPGQAVACLVLLLATASASVADEEALEVPSTCSGGPGEGPFRLPPCVEVRVMNNTADLPVTVADSFAENLSQSAGGAPASTLVDDSAFGAGLRFNMGYEIVPQESPSDTGVDISGWLEVSQTGDFRSEAAVQVGRRGARNISEFDPNPTLGIGFAVEVNPGQLVKGLVAGPTLRALRTDIDGTVRTQLLLEQNGEQTVVDETVSDSSIEEWNLCPGARAGWHVKPTVSMGIGYSHCSVSGDDYEEVAAWIRLDPSAWDEAPGFSWFD